jgi:hypothetical protein
VNLIQDYIPLAREQLVATIDVQILLFSMCVTSCARVQVNVLREEHEHSDDRVKDAIASKEELAIQLSKVMKVMLLESAQERDTSSGCSERSVRQGNQERDSMEDGQGGSEEIFAVARARSRVRALYVCGCSRARISAHMLTGLSRATKRTRSTFSSAARPPRAAHVAGLHPLYLFLLFNPLDPTWQKLLPGGMNMKTSCSREHEQRRPRRTTSYKHSESRFADPLSLSVGLRVSRAFVRFRS